MQAWTWTFVTFSHLIWGGLGLTSARVASLDVSGEADNGQGVDARQAEEQGEETVYLGENRERLVDHDVEPHHADPLSA